MDMNLIQTWLICVAQTQREAVAVASFGAYVCASWFASRRAPDYQTGAEEDHERWDMGGKLLYESSRKTFSQDTHLMYLWACGFQLVVADEPLSLPRTALTI
jgi:hypothetical protein